MKYAYMATIDVNPEDLEHLMLVLDGHRQRCLATEPGTLQFDILRPTNSDGQLALYQVYTDEAAFHVHQSGVSIAQVREETEGMQMILHVSHFECLD